MSKREMPVSADTLVDRQCILMYSHRERWFRHLLPGGPFAPFQDEPDGVVTV